MQARLEPLGFYTIGYERMAPDALFTLLKGAGVHRLVDVRDRPWSRVPGYSKASLENRLAEYLNEDGYLIKYVSMQSLGNPYKDEDWEEKYRRSLLSKGDEIEKLHSILKECTSALLCYEKDPGECHRSILAEAIGRRYGMSYGDLRS